MGALYKGKGRKTHQGTADDKYLSKKPLVWVSTNYETFGVTEERCWSREGGLQLEIKLSAQQNTPGNKGSGCELNVGHRPAAPREGPKACAKALVCLGWEGAAAQRKPEEPAVTGHLSGAQTEGRRAPLH